ncbi:uncharacterized protein F4807DRAFT_431576 [Annulohypoxylon truncatum]|uniref:uncharacterized protein n=1 Tax=Annulohypoxylon truncatum TaxID=327061 RepID=UPI0020088AF6|nr:uncharacterized protein F4807DRAFT_431576 [Annulohypoxylon truncatum]KAI1208107.1 hypothetical protein F4807DRAFT_431576 [Annulohypoxylon truncatum]
MFWRTMIDELSLSGISHSRYQSFRQNSVIMPRLFESMIPSKYKPPPDLIAARLIYRPQMQRQRLKHVLTIIICVVSPIPSTSSSVARDEEHGVSSVGYNQPLCANRLLAALFCSCSNFFKMDDRVADANQRCVAMQVSYSAGNRASSIGNTHPITSILQPDSRHSDTVLSIAIPLPALQSHCSRKCECCRCLVLATRNGHRDQKKL